MRFSHVGIVVSNMQESVDFYTTILKCKVHSQDLECDPQITLLKACDQTIELLHFSQDDNEKREGVISHIAFTVENIEEEITRLKKLGVNLSTDKPREVMDGVKIFFFTGPSGESIEFVQSPK